jgi:hypothetical protein
MIPFYTYIYNFNAEKFEPYDIMPYLHNEYENSSDKPTNFQDCQKFINSTIMYRYWSRCEYEIILQSWPNYKTEKKIDIYDQVKMNIDVVTKIFMENENIR